MVPLWQDSASDIVTLFAAEWHVANCDRNDALNSGFADTCNDVRHDLRSLNIMNAMIQTIVQSECLSSTATALNLSLNNLGRINE
eukprot:4218096-Alexandrium_andersonii.AAC.1